MGYESARMSSLHQACQLGDCVQVQALLSQGVEIDARESEAMQKIPPMLLEQGEDEVIEAGFSFCRTALMLAVLHGQTEAVRMLLKSGANFKLKDVAGWTAFGLACREGFLEAAQTLVSAGDKVGQKLPGRAVGLHVAAEGGHFEMVDWLLGQGLSIDAKTSRGETALLLAASSGHLTLVERLLEHNADPNVTSRDGRTPLTAVLVTLRRQEIPHSQAFSGQYISVQFTDDGVFALVPAPEDEILGLVELLLRSGASPTLESSNPPLSIAAHYGHLRIAKLLLEHGADPNVRSKHLEQTPLEVAQLFGRKEIAELLTPLTAV